MRAGRYGQVVDGRPADRLVTDTDEDGTFRFGRRRDTDRAGSNQRHWRFQQPVDADLGHDLFPDLVVASGEFERQHVVDFGFDLEDSSAVEDHGRVAVDGDSDVRIPGGCEGQTADAPADGWSGVRG